MAELKSLNLGNGKAHATRLSKTLRGRRTYQNP